MVSFLNPTALFGLAAAAIPVLVHLLTHHKARTIPFSSLFFLRQLEQRKLRRLKLRQALLLLLRTLLVIVLVIAFARPTLRSAGGGLRGGPSAVVVVLDHSASMARDKGGKTLFELAAERATQIAGLLGDGDEAWLVLPGAPARLAATGPMSSSDLLTQLITRQALSCEGTDIDGALRLAGKLLESAGAQNQEIYLLSDFQASAFGDKAPDSLRVPIVALPVQADHWQNLVVERVELVSKLLEQGRPVDIEVTVRNTGSHAQRNRLLQLFIDGKRAAQTSVSLDPGQLTAVTMTFVPQHSGFLNGNVVVEDDGLAFDDERFFVLNVPDSSTVLLVGEGVGVERLQLALNPTRRERPFFRITRRKETSLPLHLLAGHKVVILSNVAVVSAEDGVALRRFVEQGGGLMIVPGLHTDVRALNERLLTTLGLPIFAETIGMLGEQAPTFELADIDYGHPLFQGVFDQKAHRVHSPQFRCALRPRGSFFALQVIMRFGNGDPFLYEARLDRGRVLVFTSGFEPEWSNLTVTSLFAPLVSRAVRLLSQPEGVQQTELVVGQPLVVKLAPEDVQARLELLTPEGTRIALAPVLRQNGYAVEWDQTRRPGVYALFADGRELARVAVNVDAKESRFQPMALTDFCQRYPSAIWVEEGQDVAHKVQEARLGRELWLPCVLLALALMGVEMALYREKGEVIEEPPQEAKV
ncbi:MAG: BatA domain-containing protein [Candidatus Oleimicrobiaceae bacterium]